MAKKINTSLIHSTVDLVTSRERTRAGFILLALGELKGGIDPAGADEHWKTANSALERIRNGFRKLKSEPQTFFIGAAIENSMASEIYKQLQKGTLNNAANLTNDDQLTAVCKWILNL